MQLEAVISADTDMVLVIDDVPRFLERWSESPLGRAWNDPQVKRFLAPMRDDMEIDRGWTVGAADDDASAGIVNGIAAALAAKVVPRAGHLQPVVFRANHNAVHA